MPISTIDRSASRPACPRLSGRSLFVAPLGLVVAGLLLGGLPGCSPNPSARYTWRQSTQELIPPAREAVVAAVEKGFGTPQDFVAWERLPVAFGRAEGALAPAANGAAGAFQVQWVSQVSKPEIQAGDPVFWLTGAAVPAHREGTTVRQYDASSGTIELATPSGVTPAEGDRFVVGFGDALRRGRVAYQKNCAHCHGTTGDGNGPTAKYLNPRPRDYRLGLFKFTSTLSSERATRDDLHRIIKYGIPGTYMPSFLLMPEDDLFATTEYIRWLAMRGEYEKRLSDELIDYSETALRKSASEELTDYAAEVEKGNKPDEVPPSIDEVLTKAAEEFREYLESDWADIQIETVEFIAEAWKRPDDPESAEDVLVKPSVAQTPDSPESRERGRLLYLSDKTKCYTCHGPTGRGDGSSAEEFAKLPGSNETYAVRGLHDTWGNPVPPRDLTRGQYRGGRRPIDLFYRMYAGIKGTPMPAFGGTGLSDEEIWDIVNYVMSIQFQGSSSPKTPAVPVAQAAPGEPVATRP